MMWIPHTVVYRDADQPTWIYSNAHGEVSAAVSRMSKLCCCPLLVCLLLPSVVQADVHAMLLLL